MNIARKMQEARHAFARWQHLSNDVMRELEAMTGRYTCAHADIEKIQRIVAAHFGMDVTVMLSPARPARIAYVRQIAMTLCREQTDHRLEIIGDCFGGRDFGTVRHACKRIAELVSVDSKTAAHVSELRKRVLAELTVAKFRAAAA